MTPKDIQDVREIAIFLEGLFKGQGHIQPLGSDNLNSLWKMIREARIEELGKPKKAKRGRDN
jgi:hypothetical protein